MTSPNFGTSATPDTIAAKFPNQPIPGAKKRPKTKAKAKGRPKGKRG